MNENLEEKFENLIYEYSMLSSEHNQLKLSHDRLKKYVKHLEEENMNLHKMVQNLNTARVQSERGRSFKVGKVLSSSMTPQPKIDMGVEETQSLFEGFFIVGIDIGSLKSRPQAKLLFDHLCTDQVTAEMKASLPGLAIPKTQALHSTLTSSLTDINNVIFAAAPSTRSKNCFIFTMRTDNPSISTIFPNSNHELIYFICILTEDLIEKDNEVFITPKTYVIASYLPYFDLYFQVLYMIISEKRAHRMKLVKELDAGELLTRLSNMNITQAGVELLEKVKGISVSQVHKGIEVGGEGYFLKSRVLGDIENVDIPWLCIPLFSSLTPQDLCWLISAVVQEKSVIFTSNNLGLVTSCVLGIKALIRPFNWINLTIPIIPENLRELLEAPVPVLAGITHVEAKLRHKHANIIWVLLDEKELKHRIQFSCSHVNEVVEPSVKFLRKVEQSYNFSPDTAFDSDETLKEAAINIAGIFKYLWQTAAENFNSLKGNSLRDPKVVENSETLDKDEQRFFKSLISTQMFINSLKI